MRLCVLDGGRMTCGGDIIQAHTHACICAQTESECCYLHYHYHSRHRWMRLAWRGDSFIAAELVLFSFSAWKVLERCRLQKRLSSCPEAQGSDVELSAESDTVHQPDGEPEEEEDAANQSAGNEVQEQDLQAQVCAQHKLLWWSSVSARSFFWHEVFGKTHKNATLNLTQCKNNTKKNHIFPVACRATWCDKK